MVRKKVYPMKYWPPTDSPAFLCLGKKLKFFIKVAEMGKCDSKPVFCCLKWLLHLAVEFSAKGIPKNMIFKV